MYGVKYTLIILDQMQEKMGDTERELRILSQRIVTRKKTKKRTKMMSPRKRFSRKVSLHGVMEFATPQPPLK